VRGGLLHVEQVASILGISVRSVHEMTRQRRIPCRRIPGTRRILFDSEELFDWIDAGGDVDLEVIEGRDGGLVVRPKTRRPTELRSVQ
jgi:excisionase family DNA binding protein